MLTDYGLSTVWTVFVGIGVGTFGLRLSFVLLLGRLGDVPPTVTGLLRFVPSTVLAALVVPAVVRLSVAPSASVEIEWAKLVAGTMAALVAWRTENVLATVGVGIGVLWGVHAVV